MRRDLISSLRCPYTGSRFDVKTVSSENGSEIDFGVVSSEAGPFPVVSGVLRLLADESREPIVDLVNQGQQQEALRAALEVPFLNRLGASIDNLWRRAAQRGNPGLIAHPVRLGRQRLYRLVTQSNITFAQLAAGARVESWTNWQTYRFSMPTFLPVYALAHLAKGCHTILDFGCGLGHSSFLMKRLAADALMVCADYSFTSLYLGKRFLVPDAQYVCLDGDYPLPFLGAYFDCVFSTDALQYIEAKIGLAREFQRVLSLDGTIALAHLHNRLSPVKAGKALTPGGYSDLFEGMARRLYPEDNIVADYVVNGTLELDRQWALNDLNQALNGLSLVAANSQSAFVVRRGLLDTDIDAMRHPKLNPLYSARRSSGTSVLERNIGSPYAVERTIDGCELLPKAWNVDLESLDSAAILALREADRPTLRELVRRFVILELPESYV